jgi:Na+-transporting methylmalonyl-CoA/oxaloacetate decarboxylase gamma subunit
MGAYLSSLGYGQVMGFLIIGGGLLMGFVAIIGAFWTDIRKKEIAAALKHDMLERGMSADEIRVVIDAGTKRSKKRAAELADSHAVCCT